MEIFAFPNTSFDEAYGFDIYSATISIFLRHNPHILLLDNNTFESRVRVTNNQASVALLAHQALQRYKRD